LAEFQKQLEEERQIQELRQLQAATGQTIQTIDTSLDWMYQGPQSEAIAQKEAEEYLLGKIYKGKEEKTIDLNVPGNTFPFILCLSHCPFLNLVNIQSKPNGSWVNKVSNKNDLFSRAHEDPMMLIKLEEKKVTNSFIPITLTNLFRSSCF
jgi:hypothetical protein